MRRKDLKPQIWFPHWARCTAVVSSCSRPPRHLFDIERPPKHISQMKHVWWANWTHHWNGNKEMPEIRWFAYQGPRDTLRDTLTEGATRFFSLEPSQAVLFASSHWEPFTVEGPQLDPQLPHVVHKNAESYGKLLMLLWNCDSWLHRRHCHDVLPKIQQCILKCSIVEF